MNFTLMVAVSRCSSNDEKSVCRVAPQLLDEAELPLQVSAHRAGRRISPFIRPLVAALARTRWQGSGILADGAFVERAFYDVRIPGHLGEPRSGHLCTRAEVVAEHDARPAHGGKEVRFLNELASGCITKVG